MSAWTMNEQQTLVYGADLRPGQWEACEAHEEMQYHYAVIIMIVPGRLPLTEANGTFLPPHRVGGAVQ